MKFSLLRFGALVVVLLSACSPSQKLKKADAQTLAGLRAHVQYLADDKLEGRRTGTKGELAAADYITAQCKSIGLKPKGDILVGGVQDYDQPFEVNEGKQWKNGSPSFYCRTGSRYALVCGSERCAGRKQKQSAF